MVRLAGVLSGACLIVVGVVGGLAGALDGWGMLLGLVGILVAALSYDRGRPQSGGGGVGQPGAGAGPYGEAGSGGDGGA